MRARYGRIFSPAGREPRFVWESRVLRVDAAAGTYEVRARARVRERERERDSEIERLRD